MQVPLDKIERRFISNNQEESNEGNNQSGESGHNIEGRETTKIHIVIPYTQKIRGKHQKHMQKVWDPDPFQGKQNH